MIDEQDFQAHLQTLSPDDWNRLFILLPKIEAAEKFGEVKGGEQNENGAIQMPYWSSSAIVDEFFDVYHDLELCVVFDWMHWEDGIAILKQDNFDFIRLDTFTLCKLLTTIIRADRFNDGFLVSKFKDGTVPRVLQALSQNLNA